MLNSIAKIAAVLALVLLARPLWTAEMVRYITRQQVTAALAHAFSRTGSVNITLDRAQVSIPAVPIKKIHPTIQVEHIEVEPRTKVINARLRCAGGDCLPFYARIAEVNGSELDDFISGTRFSMHPGPRSQVVHSGDNAQLRIVLPGVRLSVPVVCLQGGAIGESIKVRRVNGGRVLVGRVESQDTLTALGR